MKQTRRIPRALSWLLCVCMVLTLLPALPMAAQAAEVPAGFEPKKNLEFRLYWKTTDPLGSGAVDNNIRDSYIEIDAGVDGPSDVTGTAFGRRDAYPKRHFFEPNVLENDNTTGFIAYYNVPITNTIGGGYYFNITVQSRVGSTRNFGGTIGIQLKDQITGNYFDYATITTGTISGGDAKMLYFNPWSSGSDYYKKYTPTQVGTSYNSGTTVLIPGKSVAPSGTPTLMTEHGYKWMSSVMEWCTYEAPYIVAADSNTPITVDGVTVSKGSGGYPFNIEVGENATLNAQFRVAFTVKSSRYDTSSTVYSNVFTIKSNDATLSALSYRVGGGDAETVPSFSASTTTYNVTLPEGTPQNAVITLNATPKYSGASITTNEGVTLANGEGTATVLVTAQDGTTTKTYTVNFTVAADPGEHTDHTGWTELTATSETLTGNCYVPEGGLTMTLTKPTTVSGDVTLCLNGQQLTSQYHLNYIDVPAGASLTICDCGTGGSVTGSNSNGVVRNAGTLTLKSGTIENTSTISDNRAVYNQNGGTFVMTGGALSADDYGLYNATSNVAAKISGGSITGGKSGIYNESQKSAVFLSGAPTISGGTSGIYTNGNASAIYANDGAETGPVSYSGGSISLAYSSMSSGKTAVYNVTEANKDKFTLITDKDYQLAYDAAAKTLNIQEERTPTLDTDGKAVYANGVPLLIAAGWKDTIIYIDANGNGALDEGEQPVIGTTEEPMNLSSYAIFGGSLGEDVEGDTRITMIGGKVAQLYGGGRSVDEVGGDVGGNTYITVKEGSITGAGLAKSIFGGGYESDVTGSTNITISDKNIENPDIDIFYPIYGGGYDNYYGGSARGAVVKGGVNITVEKGADLSDINGGGDGTTKINKVLGGVNITVNGGHVDRIFGCGVALPVEDGDVHVTVTGGQVTKVYGGANGSDHTVKNGEIYVTIQGDAQVGNVYGGGTNGASGHVAITGGVVTGEVSSGSSDTTSYNYEGSLTVGGTVQIGGEGKGIILKSVSMQNGDTSFAISQLTGTGKVYIKLPADYRLQDGGNVVATGATEDDLAKLVLTGDGAEGKTLKLDGTNVKVVAAAHADHPVCGATCTCGGSHEALTGWKKLTWDDTNITLLVDGVALEKKINSAYGSDCYTLNTGNYYLGGDIPLNSGIYVPEYETVTLCLNGHTLNANGYRNEVTGTLNVTDCQQTAGKIAGTDLTNNAKSILTVNKGTLNLYQGQLCDNHINSLSKEGGAVEVNGGSSATGTFHMYGGSITGNQAYRGGGVYIHNKGTFRMYGGTITGNTALVDYGGGVYMAGDTFEMSGGSITGNKAAKYNESYSGGGAYVSSDSKVTVSGAANITGNTGTDGITKSNLCIHKNANKITVGTLTAGAGFGVSVYPELTAGSSVTITDANGGTYQNYFSVDDTTKYELKNENGELKLYRKAAATVISVTVSPDTATVEKESTQQFTATVSGTNSPAQTVTWAVSGKNSTGTTISADGLLTVAADETAATLTVTATSTVDNTKSGTATVTVTAASPRPTVDGRDIYANGVAIEIVAGTTEDYTNILYDKDRDGTIEATEYLKIGGNEPTAAGYDLSGYTVYGGCTYDDAEATATGSTKITMTGGKVQQIYGGGEGGTFRDGPNTVNGNTEVTISGGTVSLYVYGGSDGFSTVTGDTNVTISGIAEVDKVYGGGDGGTVTGTANVTIQGDATVSDDVYGCGNNGSAGSTAVTIRGNATVSANVYGGNPDGAATLTVGGGAQIGSVWDVDGENYINGGIVIKGGEEPHGASVTDFVIGDDLTEDACVYIKLPVGFTPAEGGTLMATEAKSTDLARLHLISDGVAAEGMALKLDGTDVKVVVPPAPTVDVDGKAIYANGNALLITGTSNTNTTVYVDKDSDGEYTEGTDTAVTGATNANLSAYSVYGGGNATDTGSTKITMLSGKVKYIYGGGKGENGTVTGNTTITIKGGQVISVYGGGTEGGNVTGNTSVTVSGGDVIGSAFGGGYKGIVSGGATVNITGGTVHAAVCGGGGTEGGNDVLGTVKVNITGGTVKGGVYGGGLFGDTTGDATLTVGGGAQIGNNTEGIIINGGSITNGVDQFVIGDDLTGTDPISIVLPAGFTPANGGTIIATGAAAPSPAKPRPSRRKPCWATRPKSPARTAL